MWNVVILGLISCFADISSEMVYPIIPLYLTAAFGATPAFIGLIEGIAESLASLLKVYSGYVTDRYQNKKRLAFIGYSTGVLYKVALILSGSAMGVLGARILDRLGKGIRTSPRDVLVAESAKEGGRGKAFGVHKALDMAGSAVGILIAFILMGKIDLVKTHSQYHLIFALSIIPGLISLLLFRAVREKKDHIQKKRDRFWTNLHGIDPNLKIYLLVAFIFTLGNSSNAFLLLRAGNVGFSNRQVILLYLLYNVVAAIGAIPFGKIADYVGKKRVLVCGYFLFSVVYVGFAYAGSKGMVIASFSIYGIFTAMTAGVERAFISDLAPENIRGTALGMQSTLVGIALFPASFISGLLWTNFGPQIPFLYGSILSFLAGILLIFVKPAGRPELKKFYN